MPEPTLRLAAVLALLLLAAPACAARAQGPAEPEAVLLAAPPGTGIDDATYGRAVALLDTVLVRPERADRLEALRPGTRALGELLAAVAQDDRTPVYARGNALLMLGERGVRRLDVFGPALADPAVEVRAAAAVGLGSLLAVSYDPRTVALLQRSLGDAERDVRARALEALADHAPDVLREYLATGPQEPLASIARSMLALAEQRGAPSATGEAALGPLTKTSEHGIQLVYEPAARWPDLEATQGTLRVRLPDGGVRDLAEGVEVVAGVIPAFVTADGAAVVFESDREIHIMDVATGERHSLGAGIAPRPFPLRPSLIYFKPRDEALPGERGGSSLLYDVVEAQIEGQGRQILGTITAPISPAVRGGYTPIRWIRVREAGGGFILHSPQTAAFPLPDPFDLPR